MAFVGSEQFPGNSYYILNEKNDEILAWAGPEQFP